MGWGWAWAWDRALKKHYSRFKETQVEDYEPIMDKFNSKSNETEMEEFLKNGAFSEGDTFLEIFMECFLKKTK